MADTTADATISLVNEDAIAKVKSDDENSTKLIELKDENDLKIEINEEKDSNPIELKEDKQPEEKKVEQTDPNLVPKSTGRTRQPSLAETANIPAYNPNRRISKLEMDEMKKQIEQFTNDLIQDPVEAHRRYTLDQEEKTPDNTTEQTKPQTITESTANTQQNNDVPAALQRMMNTSRPTVRDLFDKKVTWSEFLGIYNVLRIGIAALFAVLIWSSMAGLAYLMNPNTCKTYRTKAHRIQWHPIANQIRFSWMCCLILIPAFKIFGHEWLWTHKKINKLVFIVCFANFVLLIIKGFIYDPTGDVGIVYMVVLTCLIFVVATVYVFYSNGFYLVWLMTPFIVVMIGTFGIIVGTQFVLRKVITPESALFGTTYSIMMSVLESFVLKFHYFSFPYTWGRFYTCPCNKNKFKSKMAKNYEEEEVSVQNELSDLVLFYVSMVFMAAIEAVRVTGYVMAKDDVTSLITMILWAAILECISRNNLGWEFIYRVILKKEVPGWGRVYAIWYGAKYQGEYVPIWCILFMNLLNYGPYRHCGKIMPWTEMPLAKNVNLDGKYWLFVVMFGAELLSDFLSEGVLRIGRYKKWFGVKNEEGEDPPRQQVLVKVNLFPLMWILVHSYVVAYMGFNMDHKNRAPPSIVPTPSPIMM